MISTNILLFVLVLVAAGSVALVWIIFDLKRETRDVASRASTYANVVKNWHAKLAEIEKQSPTQLAAQVAELSDAVARLAATHRRFAGRFDQYVKEPADDKLPTRDELRREHAGRMIPPGIAR